MVLSNQQGRALEYCLCYTLENFCKKAKISFDPSKYSLEANERDKRHFDKLGKEMQGDFEKFSQTALEWMQQEADLSKTKKLSLERLSDGAGFKGDVTDIVLEISYLDQKKREMRLSIKNQHNALKHPRIPRLPFHCGITDEKLIGKYMQKREKIWEDFISKGKKLNSRAKQFNQLKSKDQEFVEKNLYIPLNKLVCNFLKKNANNPKSAKKLFEFLTSTGFRFYALKNEKKFLVVKKFLGINPPTSFKTKIISPTTFLLEFNNGWTLSMRIHTASSRMYTKTGKLNKSTKYDVNCINLEEVIEIEKIPKAS